MEHKSGNAHDTSREPSQSCLTTYEWFRFSSFRSAISSIFSGSSHIPAARKKRKKCNKGLLKIHTFLYEKPANKEAGELYRNICVFKQR